MKKIAIATGTRADWGLLLPLALELRELGCEPAILVTYAHLFKELGDTVEEIINDGFVPTAEIKARMNSPEAVADTVEGFSKYFKSERPDYVIILGDRFEMLGVATAALLTDIKIAHIAGGTTSLGAYDDAIRHSISKMATLHFPETKRGRDRLILMGEDRESITVAGALGVYNALHTPLMSRRQLSESLEFDLSGDLILGTYHPATISELNPVEQMDIWLEGMERAISNNGNLKFLLTYPNSDTDPHLLVERMERFRHRYPERVFVYPSLGRVRYLSAANEATAVIGNSSSGIVEIPSLGTPVLDIGNRQSGRERSKAVSHCELYPQAIVEGIKRVTTPGFIQLAKETPNPYYKDNTPRLIAEKILRPHSTK